MNINGYEIISEISRGPISTVYLGRQRSLNRKVLIKQLNYQWREERDLLERFRREALICARLKHPNIVDIIDVETHPDNLYLIIEYVDGLDLARFIKTVRPLAFPIITYISREILKGLAYAHSQGVIHRDIKPANIMIGRDGTVKIADFGLARTADLPTISAHGEVVGTPAYMSPEQAHVSTLDTRTDLFSTGVTFYELAGQPSPFRGESIVASIQKLIRETPTPLHRSNPDIPLWYSELVVQLMAKKSEDRPASADIILELAEFQPLLAKPKDLAKLLRQHSEDFPESSLPPVFERVSHPPKPQQKRVMTGILLALLFLVTLSGTVWLHAKRGRNAPEKQLTSAIPEPNNSALALQSTSETPESKSSDLFPRSRTATADTVENTPLPANRQRIDNTPRRTERRLALSNHNDTPPDRSDTTGAFSAGAVKADAVPAAFADKRAYLDIRCLPWAHVIIDGEQRDTTPLTQPLSLSPGNHMLELQHPDFPVYRQRINLAVRQTKTLTINLYATTGYLDLQVSPWADVFLNGEFITTTPLQAPLALAPGQYILGLRNPTLPAWEDSVQIIARETVTQKISLKR